jgi:DNA recombination-mediator protein A
MTHRTPQELAYWLTLALRLEGVPRRTINGLVLTADRRASLGLLDLVGLEPDQRPAVIDKYTDALDRLLEAEGRVSAQAFLVERLSAMGAHVVPITDQEYPAHLARRLQPDRAPTVLTAVGATQIWSTPGVAISGSRKAGPSGIAFAREAGRAVARAGEVTVCGLAAGIDRDALEGALEAGGRVIGVAPEGLFHSRWVRRPEVAEGRLLIVSEFAPEDRWSVGRAMTRNRTIAGFSCALVIADCVASGGTTDQLEVHRKAGLPVYVRRGPGQGALVDELCRRPGVTPWDWTEGPVEWPPVPTDCVVSIANDRVSIRFEGPRQLELSEIVERVQAEYERATGQANVYRRPDSALGHSTAMESSPGYGATPTDAILAAINAAGERGCTTGELVEATGSSKHKVSQRLRELKDASMVGAGGRRHSYVSLAAQAPAEPPASEGTIEDSTTQTTLGLFHERHEP